MAGGQLELHPPRKRVFSVFQAVTAAKQCLIDGLPVMAIEGEISGLKIPASGHAYFNLKDEQASLPVVIWKSAFSRVRMRLEDGMQVRISGRFDLWPQQSRFQFYAERIEPIGLGDQMARLEALKAKLAAEGLFSTERKRPLPSWPRTVGVVTSASGAVIHDICRVIARRCPSRILLAAAAVQGRDAPAELIAALARLAAQPDVDVIILGRGGGSLEDLWGFNDEALVRAIAACPVPVVSAVGHDTDYTLSDLVADLRAATPSQAAEMVVPDLRHRLRELADATQRVEMAMKRRVLGHQSQLDRQKSRLLHAGRKLLKTQAESIFGLSRRLEQAMLKSIRARQQQRVELTQALGRVDPRKLTHANQQRLTKLEYRLMSAMRSQLAGARANFGSSIGRLHALSPLAVLERGYAFAVDSQGRVPNVGISLAPGDTISVRLATRVIEATVVSVHDRTSSDS